MQHTTTTSTAAIILVPRMPDSIGRHALVIPVLQSNAHMDK